MAFQSFPISIDPVAFVSFEQDAHAIRPVINLLGADPRGQTWLRRRVQGVWDSWRNLGIPSGAQGVGALDHPERDLVWSTRFFYMDGPSNSVLNEALIQLHSLQRDGTTRQCDSVRGSRVFALPHGHYGPWKDLFARGEDNHLWQRRKDAMGHWGSWRNLGGDWRDAPSAVEFKAGSNPTQTAVFARGRDYHLWYMCSAGGYTLDEKWEDWHQIGGVIISSPAAVNTGDGLIHIFARGSDDHLWHQWGRPESHTWYGWQDLGCDLTSAPTAVCPGNGHIELFWRGGDQQIWGRRWNGTVWNTAYRLGEDPSLPALTVLPPNHATDIITLVGPPAGASLHCDVDANARSNASLCTVAMERGTSVTLELSNRDGLFKSWAGDGAHAGSSYRCTVLLDRDKTVSVTYR